jgi:hypothetical protein
MVGGGRVTGIVGGDGGCRLESTAYPVHPSELHRDPRSPRYEPRYSGPVTRIVGPDAAGRR